MYRFKIGKLVVNSLNNKIEIEPKTVNIIIGPNNSGKSRFLKEIRSFLNGRENELKIIDSIENNYPKDFFELNEGYNVQNKVLRDYYGNLVLRTYAGQTSNNWDINSSIENYSTKNLNTISANWKEYFEGIIENKEKEAFFQNLGQLFYQYLGTEERLIISKIQKKLWIG